MTDEPPLPRWHVTVQYRMAAGPLDVEHDIEELVELHDLIEQGPNWDTILRIEITRINPIHGEDSELL
jgi:hypothetical protein